jgi:hypothetical protein
LPKNDILGNWVSRNAKIALVAVAVAVFIAKGLSMLHYIYPDPRAELGRAVAARVGPGECVFAVDGSGLLAYASDRCVINGDGLVNSFEYRKFVSEGNVRGWLCEQPVALVYINGRWGPRDTLRVPIRLSHDAGVVQVGDPAQRSPIFANEAGRVFDRGALFGCGRDSARHLGD